MSQTLLAKYLKMLRKKHGYTQEALSEKLGISRANYSHYENSMYVPSNDIFDSLSQLYDVPLVNFVKLSALSGKNHSPKNVKINSLIESNPQAPAFDPLYIEFIDNYSDLSKKDLNDYLSEEDFELIFYFHKLSRRDQLLALAYMKSMLQITDENI